MTGIPSHRIANKHRILSLCSLANLTCNHDSRASSHATLVACGVEIKKRRPPNMVETGRSLTVDATAVLGRISDLWLASH